MSLTLPRIFKSYGQVLTDKIRSNRYKSLFFREKELHLMMQILTSQTKKSPILLGELGCGKTTLVELFTSKILDKSVPFIFQNQNIINFNLNQIIFNNKSKKKLNIRLKQIIKGLLNYPNILLFLDNITVDNEEEKEKENSFKIVNILKFLFLKPKFQCILATDKKTYEILIKIPILKKCIEFISISPLTINETIRILYSLRTSLEKFHHIEILPSAILTTVDLSVKYLFDRVLPDKAINLLDQILTKESILLSDLNNTSKVKLNAIFNPILKSIEILKLEAFRRNDIGLEFIFQELENIYKLFFLDCITLNNLNIYNTSTFFKIFSNKIQIYIKKRINYLIINSYKKKTFINPNIILKNICIPPSQNRLTYYTISNFLFKNILVIKETKIYKFKIFNDFFNKINNFKILIYIYNKKLEPIFNNAFKSINSVNEIKLLNLKKYIKNLGPILYKVFIKTLNSSLSIKLSKKELSLTYLLLGYFSSKEGYTILNNTTEALLLQQVNFLKNKITSTKVCSFVSNIVGVSIQSLSTKESKKLLNLESTLHKQVIGQEEAISAISKAIRRARLGIQNPNRPLASFFFCGPTGVGKTEITKALAITMYGSDKEMIRFDMSEFMEKFAISRLIGSPPGYIGYEEGGQLTNAIQKKPYSIILFDEIEKAHPDILNILLQILEDGRLTDSKKQLVTFENTIIIMTSNAAANEIQKAIKSQKPIFKSKNLKNKYSYQNSYNEITKYLNSSLLNNFSNEIKNKLNLDFNNSFTTLKEYKVLKIKTNKQNEFIIKNKSKTSLKNTILEKLSTIFLPEFLNRIDDIIIFQPLKPEELFKICDLMITQVINRVKDKQINLLVDEAVKIKLSKEGYNSLYGARPLRRLITKNIEDLISETLLKSKSSKLKRTFKIILNEKNKIIIK